MQRKSIYKKVDGLVKSYNLSYSVISVKQGSRYSEALRITAFAEMTDLPTFYEIIKVKFFR
jgi:hypothetical protein